MAGTRPRAAAAVPADPGAWEPRRRNCSRFRTLSMWLTSRSLWGEDGGHDGQRDPLRVGAAGSVRCRSCTRGHGGRAGWARAVAGLVDSSRRRWALPIIQDRSSSATKDGRSRGGVINNESKE